MEHAPTSFIPKTSGMKRPFISSGAIAHRLSEVVVPFVEVAPGPPPAPIGSAHPSFRRGCRNRWSQPRAYRYRSSGASRRCAGAGCPECSGWRPAGPGCRKKVIHHPVIRFGVVAEDGKLLRRIQSESERFHVVDVGVELLSLLTQPGVVRFVIGRRLGMVLHVFSRSKSLTG